MRCPLPLGVHSRDNAIAVLSLSHLSDVSPVPLSQGQTFKVSAESEAVHHWFFPIYGNIAAYWKGFTLSYRHTLVGQSLNGLYLEGYEKISYINLSWRKNRLMIGLQCLFPFVNDKFVSETTAASPILNETSTSLRTKNHEFGITLSWNFVKGKGKYSNKSINNSDSDNGVFEF